jgi:hypothetical protein
MLKFFIDDSFEVLHSPSASPPAPSPEGEGKKVIVGYFGTV